MSQILFGKKNPKNGQSERGYVEFRSESCYPLSLGKRPFVCQTISYSVSSFQFQFRLSGVTGSARQVAFYIVLKYTLYSRLPKRIVEFLFVKRYEFDLRVILDQWTKLHLGLDVRPEIPILKGL